MITDETKSKWDSCIAFIRKHSSVLTEWANNFSISLQEQRWNGKILSMKQVKYLYEICHSVEERIG